MLVAKCTLVGVSQYAPCAPVQEERKTGEGPDQYEQRTWKQRVNRNPDGLAIIPPMAIKNALSEAAKFLSESVPGKGKATFTKHFEAGVMVFDEILLLDKSGKPYPWDKHQSERLFVPADGVRGSGKRVWKFFPFFYPWSAHVTVRVVDPIIKPEKLKEYLGHAGKFIGIGRFRPRNNGFYGRFAIEDYVCVDE